MVYPSTAICLGNMVGNGRLVVRYAARRESSSGCTGINGGKGVNGDNVAIIEHFEFPGPEDLSVSSHGFV